MPMITLTLSGNPDPERSARLAQAVADLTQRHLRKDPAVTAVAVAAIDPARWFIAGRSLAAWERAAFWLDVKVTAGTNTKAELAAFQEAAFAALERLLGPLHPESYVLVHEVPAAAYGYGGLTQEHRFVASRLARADAA